MKKLQIFATNKAIAVLKIAPAVWNATINGIFNTAFKTTAATITKTVNFAYQYLAALMQ